MPTYIYKVKDEYGRALHGFVQAKDKRDVRRRLNDPELFYVNSWPSDRNRIYQKKVKFESVLQFTQRLATLIESGIPILMAMRILWRQSDDVTMQLVVSHLRDRLEEGSQISEALSDFPRIFPNMYRALISVAEKGGDLVFVLKKLSEYLEYQREMIMRIKKATLYPSIVLVFSILVIFGMFMFVVPTFQTVLSKLKVELPALTQFILNVSTAMRTWQFFAVLVMLGLVGWLAYNWLERYQQSARWLDSFKLKIPFFGGIIYAVAISRFIRSLGLLLGAGLPAVSSFDVSRSTMDNQRLEDAVTAARKEIEEGASMYAAFNRQKIFPVMMVEMVGVGESSGSIVPILEKLTKHMDEDVDYRVNKFLTALEPMLIVFVGGVVAMTLLAIYLPITTMWSTLAG